MRKRKRGLDMAGNYYLKHGFLCNTSKGFEDNFACDFL